MLVDDAHGAASAPRRRGFRPSDTANYQSTSVLPSNPTAAHVLVVPGRADRPNGPQARHRLSACQIGGRKIKPGLTPLHRPRVESQRKIESTIAPRVEDYGLPLSSVWRKRPIASWQTGRQSAGTIDALRALPVDLSPAEQSQAGLSPPMCVVLPQQEDQQRTLALRPELRSQVHLLERAQPSSLDMDDLEVLTHAAVLWPRRPICTSEGLAGRSLGAT
jgi:hypothetical protein